MVGLNLATGDPMDPIQEGVYDSFRVLRNYIASSTGIASNLLLCDELLKARQMVSALLRTISRSRLICRLGSERRRTCRGDGKRGVRTLFIGILLSRRRVRTINLAFATPTFLTVLSCQSMILCKATPWVCHVRTVSSLNIEVPPIIARRSPFAVWCLVAAQTKGHRALLQSHELALSRGAKIAKLGSLIIGPCRKMASCWCGL